MDMMKVAVQYCSLEWMLVMLVEERMELKVWDSYSSDEGGTIGAGILHTKKEQTTVPCMHVSQALAILNHQTRT
jgi:hypothetical protein